MNSRYLQKFGNLMIQEKDSNKTKRRLSKVMTDRVRKFLGEVCQLEAERGSEEFHAFIGVTFTHTDFQSPIEAIRLFNN